MSICKLYNRGAFLYLWYFYEFLHEYYSDKVNGKIVHCTAVLAKKSEILIIGTISFDPHSCVTEERTQGQYACCRMRNSPGQNFVSVTKNMYKWVRATCVELLTVLL